MSSSRSFPRGWASRFFALFNRGLAKATSGYVRVSHGLVRKALIGVVLLLALTHLSARYAGSEVADEAAKVFPATVVPRDFDLIDVPLPERGPPELVERGDRRPRHQDVGSGT